MREQRFVTWMYYTAVLALTISGARGQQDELAPGKPPLTREMVEHRIAVWEAFLEIRLSPEQKQQLQQAMVEAWRKDKNQEIEHTIGDLKLYGNATSLNSLRVTNQAAYVENLRHHSEDAECTVLLHAYEAAHPNDRDVMDAKGLGDLVGEWEHGDALASPTNPVTGRREGISFSEGMVFSIFSDARFRHEWVHSHCSANSCCQQYGTDIQGTLTVDGSVLVLNGESGQIVSKAPCTPALNFTKPADPKRESFHWSLHEDPATQKPTLCLSGRPFQFSNEADEGVCYSKKK